tara:strand:+ start:4873 stop:5700 length:828 start_codon:yes stop_codon:yes gene_type:complete
MGVQGSSNIVLDGLKYCWDPANVKSYLPNEGNNETAIFSLITSENTTPDPVNEGSGSLGEFTFVTSSISGSTPVWKAKPSGHSTGIYVDRNRLNLNIPHTTRLNNIMTQTTNGWTIEEWILISAIPYPNTPAGYVFSGAAYASGNTGFDLNHGNGMGITGMKPGASTNSGGGYEYQTTYTVDSNLSALNKWQCRATVWDRDGDMFFGYINGTLQASGSMSAVSGEAIYDGGGAQLGTLYGWYHDGERGPFKIYDRVLTADELMQNFNAIRKRYSL